MSKTLRLSSSNNQWVLEKPFTSLGRSRTADLRIDQSAASRVHIFLYHDPLRGFMVGDAGSHNGAYLNGELILKPEVLSDADVIDVASEPLHVSLIDDDSEVQDKSPSMESGVLINARLNDEGTDWGESSTFQSRAVGEWFYRVMKLIMSHSGHVIHIMDREIIGYWDQVNQDDMATLSQTLECARQINQFTLSLDEILSSECGLESSGRLFSVHSGLHYCPLRRRIMANGQIKVEGAELILSSDLSEKARELGCEIVSTERYPSRQEDWRADQPMLMVEMGARKQGMVLFPLSAH